jgi:hypothetical protein
MVIETDSQSEDRGFEVQPGGMHGWSESTFRQCNTLGWDLLLAILRIRRKKQPIFQTENTSNQRDGKEIIMKESKILTNIFVRKK